MVWRDSSPNPHSIVMPLTLTACQHKYINVNINLNIKTTIENHKITDRPTQIVFSELYIAGQLETDSDLPITTTKLPIIYHTIPYHHSSL